MRYPWETPATAKTSASTQPRFPALVVAVLAFFLVSYFPWQPVVSLEKGSWVLIVEETEDRAKLFPWMATVQADGYFWNGLKSQGINWQFYDVDSDSILAYKPDALAAGLPALLVVSPAGRVRIAKSCPPTTSAIAELLGGIR